MDQKKVEKIEKIFGARFEDASEQKSEWCLKSSQLPLEDQEWIWEQDWTDPNYNVGQTSGNRSVLNDKTLPAFKGELNKVLKQLKSYSAKTSPKEIEACLIELFGQGSKPGHWLWMAQNYPPQRIYWELSHLRKRLMAMKEGWEAIRNPAAYFTFRMKYRKKRKVKYR